MLYVYGLSLALIVAVDIDQIAERIHTLSTRIKVVVWMIPYVVAYRTILFPTISCFRVAYKGRNINKQKQNDHNLDLRNEL